MNIMSIMLPEQRGRNGARADARERREPKGKTVEREAQFKGGEMQRRDQDEGVVSERTNGQNIHPSHSPSHSLALTGLTKPFSDISNRIFPFVTAAGYTHYTRLLTD